MYKFASTKTNADSKGVSRLMQEAFSSPVTIEDRRELITQIPPADYHSIRTSVGDFMQSLPVDSLLAFVPDDRIFRNASVFMVMNAYDLLRDRVLRAEMLEAINDVAMKFHPLKVSMPTSYFKVLESEVGRHFDLYKRSLPPALSAALPKVFQATESELYLAKQGNQEIVTLFKQRVIKTLGLLPEARGALIARATTNLAFAVAFALPSILNSEEPVKELEHWSVLIAGGFIGGKAAAITSAAPCGFTGAGTPVCVAAVTFAGGFFGMAGAETVWQSTLVEKSAEGPRAIIDEQWLSDPAVDAELQVYVTSQRAYRLQSTLSELAIFRKAVISPESLRVPRLVAQGFSMDTAPICYKFEQTAGEVSRARPTSRSFFQEGSSLVSVSPTPLFPTCAAFLAQQATERISQVCAPPGIDASIPHTWQPARHYVGDAFIKAVQPARAPTLSKQSALQASSMFTPSITQMHQTAADFQKLTQALQTKFS
jgi:hypothetical protein